MKQMHRAMLLALIAAQLLGACSSMQSLIFPPGVKLSWDQVALHIDPAANRDFPVAVDIVLVMDESLARKVSGLKASEWFAARDGLRKLHPGELEIESAELAPGEMLTLPGKRFDGKRVFAAFAFADYFSNGEHRARLDSFKGKIILEFGATDFSVSASEK